jgi:hypothetical protein
MKTHKARGKAKKEKRLDGTDRIKARIMHESAYDRSDPSILLMLIIHRGE